VLFPVVCFKITLLAFSVQGESKKWKLFNLVTLYAVSLGICLFKARIQFPWSFLRNFYPLQFFRISTSLGDILQNPFWGPKNHFYGKVPQNFACLYLSWVLRYSNGKPLKISSFLCSFQWCALKSPCWSLVYRVSQKSEICLVWSRCTQFHWEFWRNLYLLITKFILETRNSISLKKCLKTLDSWTVFRGTATVNHLKISFFSPLSSDVPQNYLGGLWCTGWIKKAKLEFGHPVQF